MENRREKQRIFRQYFHRIVLLLAMIFVTNTFVTYAQECNSSSNDASLKPLQKKIAECVWDGKLEELKALVEEDTKLANLKLDNEETALTMASYSGNIDIVKYLLTKQVDIESKNKWNNNALINAAQKGHIEIGKLLIEKGANLESIGSYGYTPLHTALAYNKPEFALMLINRGSNIAATDQKDRPAIIHASWYGHPEVIKAIAGRGGDINAVTTGNSSVLHNVCNNGNIESIEFLINKGANVNLTDDNGNLPLHIAASNKNSKAVGMLAKKTSNLDQKNKHSGNTALHIAAINGDIQSTQYLIEAGANAKIVNNEGFNPAEYAAKFGYVQLTKFHSSKNKDFNNTVKKAQMTLASVKEKLGPNEVKIWHTGHSGWALQFTDKIIITDYWQSTPKGDEASLTNGYINPDELKGKKVYVFVSHAHRDHYDTCIFAWQKEIKDIKYIYGFEPKKNYQGPSYKYFNDNQTGTVDDIKITTIKSNDAGQGFLIETNGITIFHPGDHALFNGDLEADYKKEIDFIASQTKGVDIAFLPVTGCPSSWKKEYIVKGFLYVLDKLSPNEVFPMHAFQRAFLLNDFAQIAKEKKYKNKITCTQNKGDHYLYSKSAMANK